jgi:N-acetyl-anhydromuramyl-L-alanine amidase AmpD
VGSQGPHDRGHSDYATTTIARRPLSASPAPEDNEGEGVPISLPSPHFSPGRPFGPPRLLVLHTTENECAPGVAAAVARYFAAPLTQASAHYVVGPDAVYQCVADGDRAWHVGAAGNPRSIGVEQTGRARFSAEEWRGEAAQAMLSRVVDLLAVLCRRWGIPPVVVEGPALAAPGASGITTHAAVAAALGGTTHWDPGPAYPLDSVVARVAAMVGSAP